MNDKFPPVTAPADRPTILVVEDDAHIRDDGTGDASSKFLRGNRLQLRLGGLPTRDQLVVDHKVVVD